jgi:hypothetical protein
MGKPIGVAGPVHNSGIHLSPRAVFHLFEVAGKAWYSF